MVTDGRDSKIRRLQYRKIMMYGFSDAYTLIFPSQLSDRILCPAAPLRNMISAALDCCTATMSMPVTESCQIV